MKLPRWNVQPTVESRGLWRGLVSLIARPEREPIGGKQPSSPVDLGGGIFTTANYPAEPRLTPLVNGTILVGVAMITDPVSTKNSRIGFFVGDSDNEMIGFRYESGNFRRFTRRDISTITTLEASISFPYVHAWAITWNSTKDEATVYKDGVQFGSPAISGTTPFVGGSNWLNQIVMPVEYYYVWNRRLSVADLRLLASDPFVLIRPPRHLLPMLVPGERPLPRIIQRSP